MFLTQSGYLRRALLLPLCGVCWYSLCHFCIDDTLYTGWDPELLSVAELSIPHTQQICNKNRTPHITDTQNIEYISSEINDCI